MSQKFRAVLKDRSRMLTEEGYVDNSKKENGEFYYRFVEKDQGMVNRRWVHESEVEILD